MERSRRRSNRWNFSPSGTFSTFPYLSALASWPHSHICRVTVNTSGHLWQISSPSQSVKVLWRPVNLPCYFINYKRYTIIISLKLSFNQSVHTPIMLSPLISSGPRQDVGDWLSLWEFRRLRDICSVWIIHWPPIMWRALIQFLFLDNACALLLSSQLHISMWSYWELSWRIGDDFKISHRSQRWDHLDHILVFFTIFMKLDDFACSFNLGICAAWNIWPLVQVNRSSA